MAAKGGAAGASLSLEEVLSLIGLLLLALGVFVYAEWATVRITTIRVTAWSLYAATRLHLPGARTHYLQLLRDYRALPLTVLWRWTGAAWRWVLAPLMGLWAARLLFHDPARHLRATLDLKGLLWRHAQHFPSAYPAACAMRAGRLTETPSDSGPWAQAQTPRAYCEGLMGVGAPWPTTLTSEVRAQWETAMRPALGRVVRGEADLLFHEQALLAVCALFVHGDGPGRAGDALLDALSRGFREREGAKAATLVLPEGGREVSRVISHPDHRAFFVSLFKHHAWSTTVLMRALNEGRRKGMIPPSRFLWLKPADRSLWYALHQLAPPLPNEKLRAKRVLAEAAAAHSHYKAEVITNVRCETPILTAAVDGLWEAVATGNKEGG